VRRIRTKTSPEAHTLEKREPPSAARHGVQGEARGVARSHRPLFYSLLDEKQRRLFAGLESLKQGHGGDRHIAGLLGLDAHTVSKGRRELLESDQIDRDRVRQKGAGRKPVEKKRPKSLSESTNS